MHRLAQLLNRARFRCGDGLLWHRRQYAMHFNFICQDRHFRRLHHRMLRELFGVVRLGIPFQHQAAFMVKNLEGAYAPSKPVAKTRLQ